MDGELRRLNITTAQYAALSALEENPDSSNAALARACFVSAQTMIEILQSLERSGFISRRSHPEHGRILQTSLTAQGQQELDQAHQVVYRIQEQMLAGFSEEERLQMINYLVRGCENLETPNANQTITPT